MGLMVMGYWFVVETSYYGVSTLWRLYVVARFYDAVNGITARSKIPFTYARTIP